MGQGGSCLGDLVQEDFGLGGFWLGGFWHGGFWHGGILAFFFVQGDSVRGGFVWGDFVRGDFVLEPNSCIGISIVHIQKYKDYTDVFECLTAYTES